MEQSSFFDRELETAPRERLEAVQLRKLRAMLDELWGRNRFYTAKLRAAGADPRDVKALTDLCALPATTKQELAEDQAAQPELAGGSNLTYPAERYIRWHRTSGTTGRPLQVFDTAESWQWWGRCWAHVLAAAGLTPADRLFVAFSFSPFIGFWAAMEGARLSGIRAIPAGGLGSLQRLALIEEARATALCCTPTYALRLAAVARENGIDLAGMGLRATVHAGEPGANVPATKRRIEEAFGGRCFDHAGASEVGAHSYECQAQPGGIHVLESEFIIEVADPETNRLVGPGRRGELVLTNLGRLGFPVIRYRTGDAVQIDPKPCACGRTLVRLAGGILGRVDDMITVRGVNVFPGAIEDLVRRFREVDEFRVTVRREREMEEMEVEVELTAGADPAVASAIGRSIDGALGVRAQVTSVPRSTLPRFETKAARFHVMS